MSEHPPSPARVVTRRLSDEWRKQATELREEAGRIRRTVKAATDAEERCNVRAEIYDKCADQLDALLVVERREPSGAVEQARQTLLSLFDNRSYDENNLAVAYVDDLIAAVRVERREGDDPHGWQPIETAPRDGRYLLVSGPKPRGGTYVDICSYYKTAWSIVWMDDRGEPTHWMPLPSPPDAPKET